MLDNYTHNKKTRCVRGCVYVCAPKNAHMNLQKTFTHKNTPKNKCDKLKHTYKIRCVCVCVPICVCMYMCVYVKTDTQIYNTWA